MSEWKCCVAVHEERRGGGDAQPHILLADSQLIESMSGILCACGCVADVSGWESTQWMFRGRVIEHTGRFIVYTRGGAAPGPAHASFSSSLRVAHDA